MNRIWVAGVVMLAAIGCGKSEEQKAAEAMAKGAEQAAQGAQAAAQGAQQAAQQVTQGFQQMAQGLQQMQGNVNVVDFEKLKEMLPELPGWTRSDVRGEQVSMGMKLSRAEARYTNGDQRMKLEITDTALAQMLLAPLSLYLGSGYSERSDSGYKRAAAIGGHPGFEEWTTSSKHGEVTAVVGNRFIVNAEGDDVENIETPKRLLQAVDLAKLASMK